MPRANAVRGQVSLADTRNSYVASEDIHTAVIGLDDVAVITTKDAVLVARRDVGNELKTLVAGLRSDKDTRSPRRRASPRAAPLGILRKRRSRARFQVKRIVVKPGARLSLQKHFHRSEHWIVVQGTATVEVDGEARIVRENENAYIPLGAWHRLSNEGKIDLELIEVQSGSYLARTTSSGRRTTTSGLNGGPDHPGQSLVRGLHRNPSVERRPSSETTRSWPSCESSDADISLTRCLSSPRGGVSTAFRRTSADRRAATISPIVRGAPSWTWAMRGAAPPRARRWLPPNQDSDLRRASGGR